MQEPSILGYKLKNRTLNFYKLSSNSISENVQLIFFKSLINSIESGPSNLLLYCPMYRWIQNKGRTAIGALCLNKNCQKETGYYTVL